MTIVRLASANDYIAGVASYEDEPGRRAAVRALHTSIRAAGARTHIFASFEFKPGDYRGDPMRQHGWVGLKWRLVP